MVIAAVAAAVALSGCGRMREGGEMERVRESAEKIRTRLEPFFVPPLTTSVGAPSWTEFLTMRRLDGESGLDGAILFNRYGEVRWARDASSITKTFDDYNGRPAAATDPIEVARKTLRVTVGRLDRPGRYAAYIPFALGAEVQGVLELRGSPDAIAAIARAPDPLLVFDEMPADGRGLSSRWQTAAETYMAGLIFLQAGDTARAVAELERALISDPASRDIAMALARAKRERAAQPRK